MSRYKLAASAVLLLAGSAVTLAADPPRPAGSTRTDLQRHDLNIAGREVLQARVDFAPGAAFPAHYHPGEEIIYVLEGSIEYEVEGKSPVTLNAGDVLFVRPEWRIRRETSAAARARSLRPMS